MRFMLFLTSLAVPQISPEEFQKGFQQLGGLMDQVQQDAAARYKERVAAASSAKGGPAKPKAPKPKLQPGETRVERVGNKWVIKTNQGTKTITSPSKPQSTPKSTSSQNSSKSKSSTPRSRF